MTIQSFRQKAIGNEIKKELISDYGAKIEQIVRVRNKQERIRHFILFVRKNENEDKK